MKWPILVSVSEILIVNCYILPYSEGGGAVKTLANFLQSLFQLLESTLNTFKLLNFKQDQPSSSCKNLTYDNFSQRNDGGTKLWSGETPTK